MNPDLYSDLQATPLTNNFWKKKFKWKNIRRLETWPKKMLILFARELYFLQKMHNALKHTQKQFSFLCFWEIIDFVLKMFRKMWPRDFCEPNSETWIRFALTS